MIQRPFIKRAVYFIPERISRFNESSEDIYRHLLTVLVSYLKYNIIKMTRIKIKTLKG